MYKDKFVLSVIHDGSPVKETGRRSKKEVAIPFGSEYRIRLKNKNSRSCTARVFIDGRRVSELGDFIIYDGGTVDLERFVDRSLDNGKRFKFVSLDHEDVDDPTSSDNGIIKVEFRLAKQFDGIKILPPRPWPEPPKDAWPTQPDAGPYYEDNNGTKWGRTHWDSETVEGFTGGTTTVNYCNSTGGDTGNSDRGFKKCKGKVTSNVTMDAMVDAGATVEGGKSGQSFTYSDLKVDNTRVVTLRLKMVGINKERSMGKYKYCTNCGSGVRRKDKYCSECGHSRRSR